MHVDCAIIEDEWGEYGSQVWDTTMTCTSRSRLFAVRISFLAVSSSFLISWSASTLSDAGISCEVSNAALAAFAMDSAGLELLADMSVISRSLYNGTNKIQKVWNWRVKLPRWLWVSVGRVLKEQVVLSHQIWSLSYLISFDADLNITSLDINIHHGPSHYSCNVSVPVILTWYLREMLTST